MVHPFLSIGLALSLGACAAAALAGAGAATGIYLTTRGAESIVEGSVPDLDRRTGLVLAREGAEVTERTVAGDGSRVKIDGKTRDGQDLTVEIEKKTATTTKVDVAVRKNAVVWDQDYARRILERIVTTR
jgi:hypothetical protein